MAADGLIKVQSSHGPADMMERLVAGIRACKDYQAAIKRSNFCGSFWLDCGKVSAACEVQRCVR